LRKRLCTPNPQGGRPLVFQRRRPFYQRRRPEGSLDRSRAVAWTAALVRGIVPKRQLHQIRIDTHLSHVGHDVGGQILHPRHGILDGHADIGIPRLVNAYRSRLRSATHSAPKGECARRCAIQCSDLDGVQIQRANMTAQFNRLYDVAAKLVETHRRCVVRKRSRSEGG
jgi:hypothetical protein